MGTQARRAWSASTQMAMVVMNNSVLIAILGLIAVLMAGQLIALALVVSRLTWIREVFLPWMVTISQQLKTKGS
jgi:predicted membrane protein